MPKVKQCAQKSKKKNFAKVQKFASQAAEVKYHNSIRHKDFYVERGMMEKETEFGDMPQWLIDTINKRKLKYLCLPPEPPIPELVKEFYSNFLDKEYPTELIVHEVEVPFSAEEINGIFLLEEVPCEFSKVRKKLSDELMMDIIPELAKPEAEWSIDTNGAFHFKRTELQHDIKCLYSFVQTSLLPMSHDSTVSRERMWMLYCIMKGMKIEVGRVIAKEICDCAHREKGKLFFLYLITTLCRAAGVPIWPEEGTVPLKGLISFGPARAPKSTTAAASASMTRLWRGWPSKKLCNINISAAVTDV